MAELGETTDPVALVPGAVDALFAVVDAWRERARAATDVAARVRAVSAPEGWLGDAADAFAARCETVAAGWEQTEHLLSACADALDTYATTLGWAQQKAGDAVAIWQTAMERTAAGIERYRAAERRAGATGVVPLYVDEGASARSEAQSLLAYARSEVQDAGDTAASSLRALEPPRAVSWSDIGSAALVSAEAVALLQWDNLVDIVNDTASVGNAMLRNPDALLALLGGGAMMLGGGGLALGGGGLSATGVGAAAGVPAVAGGVAAAGAGAALAGAGASKIAADALGGAGVMLIEKQRGVDRGDGRDDYGHFAPGQESKPWVDKEKVGLDEVEEQIGAPIERKKALSSIEGSNQQRYFDGFYKNPDGTYTAVEVKSGSGYAKYLRNEGNQRDFDSSISPSSPATAVLNGQRIKIIDVELRWSRDNESFLLYDGRRIDGIQVQVPRAPRSNRPSSPTPPLRQKIHIHPDSVGRRSGFCRRRA